METTEKKVSHTPGPWRIKRGQYLYQEYDNNGGGIGDEQGYVVSLRFDQTNVDVWGHRTSKSVTEANAKLIAAAPDLLKSLQAIVAAGQLAIHAGDEAKHSFTEMAIQNALHAIKKAT